MRTIAGHHDSSVVDTRLAPLIREVRERDPGGAFAPAAIVAPTRRLIGHLRVRLADAFPALLNLHFFHHDSLARAAAAAAPFPAALCEGAREAVIESIVARGGEDLAAYVASRPGSVAALRSLGARGLTDRSGCLRSALPHLETFGRRFRLVIHYGAYDLIGVNLDLVRALEGSGVRIIYLTPFHPVSPAFVGARRFWPEALRAPVEVLDVPGGDRILGDDLPLLYDEGAVPAALDADRVDFFHAQGAAAELREVALRIRTLHRDHRVSLGRIAVIARSLEPYASLLRPVFTAHGSPFTTSACPGALRVARAQAALTAYTGNSLPERRGVASAGLAIPFLRPRRLAGRPCLKGCLDFAARGGFL